MTNQKHYTKDQRQFVREGGVFGTAAQEWPGNVALGWEVTFLRASSEQHWNQRGSSRQSRSAWIRPTVHIWTQFVPMCLRYPNFYPVSLFEGVKENLSLTSDAPLFHDSFPVMRLICDFLMCVIYCYCRFIFFFSAVSILTSKNVQLLLSNARVGFAGFVLFCFVLK